MKTPIECLDFCALNIPQKILLITHKNFVLFLRNIAVQMNVMLLLL